MTFFSENFLNPERLWWWALIPLLVLLYIWATRRKNRTGMRFTNTSVLNAVIPRQSQWRRHLAFALSLANDCRGVLDDADGSRGSDVLDALVRGYRGERLPRVRPGSAH